MCIVVLYELLPSYPLIPYYLVFVQILYHTFNNKLMIVLHILVLELLLLP